jgi:hypothetical protein
MDNPSISQYRRKSADTTYWLTPVRSDETATAEEVVQQLISTDGIYGFGERTPGRKHVKPGDWIAFYATGKGVVAHAQIVSLPEYKPHPSIRHSERYPWVFQVEEPCLYLDEPIVIDATVRSRLDKFHGRDASTSWAWFVQSTRRISAHDFGVLTGQEAR